MLPRWTPRILGLLLSLLTLALPDVAEAQSVTLNQAGFQFLREVRRPDGQLPNWISRRDCLEDDARFDADPNFQRPTIRMSPNVQGARTGWALEVWVGSGVDCSNDEQRNAVNNQRCWQVAVSNNPTMAVVQLDVSPRAVAAGAQTPREVFDPTDPAACEQQIQIPLTFFLLLVDGAGNLQGTGARWEDTSLDLLGPAAPTDVRAGIGEEKLVAKWEVPIESDQDDIDGFAVFCDRAGGTPPAGLAGAAGVAGMGNVGDGSCTSANLVPGRLPDPDFQCALAGGRGTREARTHRLENSVEFAIAVAGVDRVGNTGPLSALACGTPQEVTSFFEAYREAGGRGGGGFCGWAAPMPTGSFGGALAVATLWWWRRRRRAA